MSMKRLVLAGAIAFVIMTICTGCAYLKIQRPHDKDFANTELGRKEGRSSFKSILWFVAWGDAGSTAAADNGGIAVIKHADVEYYAILGGLYSRITTVVYGD